MKLYQKIALAVVVGLLAGVLLGEKAAYVKPIGDIFIRCLRLVVIPLVFSSLIVGIASTGDTKGLGRLGGTTMAYFTLTTVVAVSLGLFAANILTPGASLTLGKVDHLGPVERQTTAHMLVNLFPVNPMESFAKGNVLQIIIFALFFGVGLAHFPKDGAPVLHFFQGVVKIMLKISEIVMGFAPYGIFCLMAFTAGKFGLSILLPMTKLIFTVFVASLLHILLTYSLMVGLFSKVSPLQFLKAALQPALVGFTTCSAAAAYPFSLKAQEGLGVPKKIFGFTLPMALTINMDGTAIYQAVVATFIAYAYGIDLSFNQQCTIVLTAELASVGTASVPSGGLIMLTLVLESVGLPLEGIALVAGVDRILDMFRTSTNIFGDQSAGLFVASMCDKPQEAPMVLKES